MIIGSRFTKVRVMVTSRSSRGKVPHPQEGERRAAPRYLACFAAQVRLLSDGAALPCVTRELSRLGGLLLTQLNLHPGQPVDVEVFLPFHDTPSVVSRSHVVRTVRRRLGNTFWGWEAAVQYDEPGLAADIVTAAQGFARRLGGKT